MKAHELRASLFNFDSAAIGRLRRSVSVCDSKMNKLLFLFTIFFTQGHSILNGYDPMEVTFNYSQPVVGEFRKFSPSRLIGEPVSVHYYSYVVILDYSQPQHLRHTQCHGSIIDSWFILTAASCTHERIAENFTVIILTDRISQAEERNKFSVAEIITHPEFDPYFLTFNLALLKLTEPITSTSVTHVKLPTSSTPDHGSFVVGYGFPESSPWHRTTAQGLFRKDLSIMPEFLCNEQLSDENFQYVHSKMLCAIDASAPDAPSLSSFADAGIGYVNEVVGLLYRSYEIHGVAFIPRDPATLKVFKPSVYTRVRPLVGWIKKTIKTTLKEKFTFLKSRFREGMDNLATKIPKRWRNVD